MNLPLESIDPAEVTKNASIIFAQGTDAMEKWSDEKKNNFCEVFESRTRVSAWILCVTAEKLLATAERRQFVSAKAAQKTRAKYDTTNKTVNSYAVAAYARTYPQSWLIGGRPAEELSAIAATRADEIFKNLPPLRQAVAIIKPEVAKKMDELERKKTKAKKLSEELDQPRFNTEIKLSDVDQNMTIRTFRKMMKDMVADRKALANKLNAALTEASELDDEIAKDLYGGIPELQEAILEVVAHHYERASAMGGMSRRVQEHVKFGDSKAAVEMVKQFEADELAVSPNIKAEFDAALARLQLSAPMIRKAAKQLKEKKS